MNQDLVLVTGGTGYLGAYCIAALLRAGYRVRATVRSLDREADLRAMLGEAGLDSDTDQLSLVTADLLSDDGWPAAVAGCAYVLHVASPFPIALPKNPDDLVVPAREGTLRVLRAARDAGVRRVVLTSSFVAVGYGHPAPPDQPYTETTWTDVDGPGVSAYGKSKTLAERAAWDFIAAEGGALELAVVNPVGIFGPVLGPDLSTSIQIIQQLMSGALPAVPRMSFGLVDVRDVADLEVLAMTNPDAAGERFLAVAGESMTLPAMAALLRARTGPAGRKIPRRVLPDWVVRVAALFSPTMRQVVGELGTSRQVSNEKARRVLGWSPRPNEEVLLATATSLVDHGLVGPGASARR